MWRIDRLLKSKAVRQSKLLDFAGQDYEAKAKHFVLLKMNMNIAQ